MSNQVQREQIIADNNSETILSQIVDATNFSQTSELRINTVLRGDVDFSILKDRDIQNISAIYIEKPGEITNLYNIPETVKIIHCPEQLLDKVENLPRDLEELNLENNSIKKFNAETLTKLVNLNISHNELTELSNLPESIEILNIENNQLKQLDLETTQNLKHLICSNNPILVLQNVPRSVDKIEMDNNPFIEIDDKEVDSEKKSKKKLDYLESINEYFRLKNEYEKAFLTLKRKAYQRGGTKKEKKRLVGDVKAQCIYCKRKVGSLFTHKDKYYTAKCGDQRSPCKLDISIYEGDHTNIEEVINLFSDDIEEDKEQIIIDKLNSVFKYVNAESYAEDFKEHITNYNETSDIYKETLDRYDLIHNSEEKKLSIEKKTGEIIKIKDDLNKILEEYKKTGNNKLLKTMLATYKRDFIPAIEHLRKLTYAHMFVEITDSEPPVTKLIQYLVPVHARDFIFGEEPNVLKFVTNTDV